MGAQSRGPRKVAQRAWPPKPVVQTAATTEAAARRGLQARLASSPASTAAFKDAGKRGGGSAAKAQPTKGRRTAHARTRSNRRGGAPTRVTRLSIKKGADQTSIVGIPWRHCSLRRRVGAGFIFARDGLRLARIVSRAKEPDLDGSLGHLEDRRDSRTSSDRRGAITAPHDKEEAARPGDARWLASRTACAALSGRPQGRADRRRPRRPQRKRRGQYRARNPAPRDGRCRTARTGGRADRTREGRGTPMRNVSWARSSASSGPTNRARKP